MFEACRLPIRSAQFSIREYGGKDTVFVMATEWCHRMQFWCDMWIAEGSCETFVFTRAMANDYVESLEFTNLAAEGTALTKKRCAWIRSIIPSRK